MATPGRRPEALVGRNDTVRLDPAHVERDCDEDENRNRQRDAQGQKLDRAIGVAAIADQREHARTEAEYDQREHDENDDFDDRHVQLYAAN